MSTSEQILQRLDKLDERIIKVERYIWMAFGALAVLQFVFPFVKKLLIGE